MKHTYGKNCLIRWKYSHGDIFGRDQMPRNRRWYMLLMDDSTDKVISAICIANTPLMRYCFP